MARLVYCFVRELRNEGDKPLIEHENPLSDLFKARTERKKQFVEGDKRFIDLHKAFIEHEKPLSDPEKTRIEAEKLFSDPDKARIDPDKLFVDPEKVLSDPEKPFSEQYIPPSSGTDYLSGL